METTIEQKIQRLERELAEARRELELSHLSATELLEKLPVNRGIIRTGEYGFVVVTRDRTAGARASLEHLPDGGYAFHRTGFLALRAAVCKGSE